MIDWSRCPDVESVPDRCHGAPVVKGTRVMVQGILDNFEGGCSVEEIATQIFEGVTVEIVQRILAFATEQTRIANLLRNRPRALPKERLTAARIMSLKPRKPDEP